MLDRELELCMHWVFAKAKTMGHSTIGLEHLLLGLLEDPFVVSTLKSARVDLLGLKQSLIEFLETTEDFKGKRGGERVLGATQANSGFHRVWREAGLIAKGSGLREVSAVHVLIGILNETEGVAYELLRKFGANPFNLLQALSDREILENPYASAPGSHFSKKNHGFFSAEKDAEKAGDLSEVKACLLNLTELAHEGKIEPLIGRHEELHQVLQILCRRKKDNPLLIGDAGVGKTAIMEGLAYRLTKKGVPAALRNAVVISLDIAALLAGTKYRGDLERRCKRLVDYLHTINRVILAIDEIHLLLGAGNTSGGQVDLANLLKPSLTSGKLRVLGATTLHEYRQCFERDKAFSRRFQKVFVKEPTEEEAFKILKGLQSRYEAHHKVRYTNASLRAAVSLSSHYLPDRALPDKAIDLIDEMGSLAQIRSNRSKRSIILNAEDAQPILYQILQRPLIGPFSKKIISFEKLEKALHARVLGQPQAIQGLIEAVKLAQAGLREGRKPIGSLLLVGPPGVGKTELGKATAEALELPLVRFNLAEFGEQHTVSRFLGAPPGYVGYDKGGALTEAVSRHPNAVLLLDEIEKAHPDLLNMLLQIMDEGWIKDSQDRRTSFSNVLLMMTSNLGHRNGDKGLVGFHHGAETVWDKALQETLTPEFRSRLDRILYFYPLSKETFAQLIENYLERCNRRLERQGLQVLLDKSAQEFLLREESRVVGARQFLNRIQSRIETPLADIVLSGDYRKGGVVCFEIDAQGAWSYRWTHRSESRPIRDIKESSYNFLCEDGSLNAQR